MSCLKIAGRDTGAASTFLMGEEGSLGALHLISWGSGDGGVDG